MPPVCLSTCELLGLTDAEQDTHKKNTARVPNKPPECVYFQIWPRTQWFMVLKRLLGISHALIGDIRAPTSTLNELVLTCDAFVLFCRSGDGPGWDARLEFAEGTDMSLSTLLILLYVHAFVLRSYPAVITHHHSPVRSTTLVGRTESESTQKDQSSTSQPGTTIASRRRPSTAGHPNLWMRF